MTPASDHLIDMFEKMKRQNQDQLNRVEKMPGFRMVQWTGGGEVDVTKEYIQRLRDSIDEWQRAIDYLKQHDS
jgi:hypothetical protein